VRSLPGVPRKPASLRSVDGQTTAEYVGGLLVVSVIIAAVALTAVGSDIRRHIECTVASIVGQTCTAAQENGVDPECLLASDTRESNFSVNIIAVKVGEGSTLIKETYADGRTVFTLADNAEVAAELFAGAKAHAGKIGFDASASVAAGGKLEGAQVFEFTADQQEQADAFEHAVRNEGTFTNFLHQQFESGGVLGAIGLDPLHGVKDWAADHIFGDDADNLPKPTSTYVDASLFVEGEAEASAGIPELDASLKGALKGAGGVKVTTSGKDAGTAEVYFELSAEAAGQLGILALGPGIGGDAKFTATMTMSKRADGSYGPSKLRVVGTAGYSGSPLNLDGATDFKDVKGLSGWLKEATIKADTGSGEQLEFAADLDLNDSRNLRAALGVLGPSGVSGAGVQDLVDRFDKDGRLTLQSYDTTASDTSAEIKLGAGINGGAGGGQKEDGQQLTSSVVREPGGTFQPRSCGLS
jgi:hypothetical protein